MSLSKDGYRDAQQAVTKVKVPITADGNIAQSGDTATGTKSFRVNQVNAANGLTDNQDILNLFIGFAGGTTDSVSNTMAVTWEV